MFRSGQFVADNIQPVTDEQIQPNGVDITLETIHQQTSPGQIRKEGTQIGERQQLTADSGSDCYRLDPGHYIVVYAETISIPTEHIGFIYPRSSLLRNSCMLDTAVWDAGYEGKGEGLLEVNHEIEIEQGARIGQLVLAAADHAGTYSGTYQRERLE
jgi:deoxycytidine triphosphate deaminase